jgi:hypothetical protein
MCTLLALRSIDGPVVGSNSDNPYLVGSRAVASVDGALPFVGSEVLQHLADTTMPWNGMLTRGVNAAGVGFTYSALTGPAEENDTVDGAIDPDATRELLGAAATAAGFAEGLQQAAGRLLDGNYLVVDSDDVLVVTVERDRSWLRRPSVDDRVACTNVSFAEPDRTPEEFAIETRSFERLAQATQGLAAVGSTVDEADAVRALATVLRSGDGGRGSTLPDTVESHGVDSGTISSELIAPHSRRFWWCYGWPSGEARGHETFARESWGRYVPFDVARVTRSGPLTTPDGFLTLYGTEVMGA